MSEHDQLTIEGGDPGRLLTVRETAEMFGRTEKALRFQMHQGTAPPSAMVMGRRVFRESDVRAWIDAHFAEDAAVEE